VITLICGSHPDTRGGGGGVGVGVARNGSPPGVAPALRLYRPLPDAIALKMVGLKVGKKFKRQI